MNQNNWLDRTEKLIGKENLQKLKNSNIVVFGLGGVGSYVVEALIRSGIEHIAIIDSDIVDITNINRQLIADINNVGISKVKVESERILNINPNAKIIAINNFIDKNNLPKVMENINTNFALGNTSDNFNIDYVIDAIDTISSKLEIIKFCHTNNINLISCMGTGNKLDCSKFKIVDINKTSVCPLARIIRKELKKLQIPHLKVLYSDEIPLKTNSSAPASISFVPSTAGLMIAGEVIRSLCFDYVES